MQRSAPIPDEDEEAGELVAAAEPHP